VPCSTLQPKGSPLRQSCPCACSKRPCHSKANWWTDTSPTYLGISDTPPESSTLPDPPSSGQTHQLNTPKFITFFTIIHT